MSAWQWLALRCAARGLTRSAAGRELGWSERTVARLLADARRSLGVCSTTHAIVLARRADLL